MKTGILGVIYQQRKFFLDSCQPLKIGQTA